MYTELFSYVKKNWFKISLAAVFIFAAFKKDLSFHINLNTPAPLEQVKPEPPAPVQSSKEEREEGTLTENLDKPEVISSTSVDHFKLSPLGESGRAAATAYDQLTGVAEDKITAYLTRFTQVAISEEKKFGVPASIVLGNALLMSRAGEREMAVEGNNHFALRCTTDWQGETGKYDSKCYRHYDIAWTSFRDHSLYLTTGAMGRHFDGLARDNYKGWARALEKTGFSGEKDYAKQLTRVIQKYGLDKLDR